ncbi:MAG: DUF2336 domain-containing protein [Devosiaceae bacterium]|nr:DUF2336 domain-containing protein [Devosiaceae bacterium MH13]
MSELVDFERVESTHSQEERNQLMAHVAQLYAMSSDRINPELLSVYDSVLVRLADLVEEEALAFVSEKLAPLTNAPRSMVRKLASEPIDVARPVLEQSPVLSDSDLVEIAGETGVSHLEAIAGRESVAPIVSAVLVERGDEPVKLRLAKNKGAELFESSYIKLVQDASRNEDLQASLAEREDLPVTVVRALVDVASVNVRRKLLRHGKPEVARRVGEAAGLAAERLSNEQWLSRYDFEAAYRSVSLAVKKQPVNEASVFAMARAGRFAEAVVMFALCAAVPLEDAKHWCVRSDCKPFLIMCKALGFSEETVLAFLQLGPWLRRLDRDARERAMFDYGTIDVSVAREIVSQWRSNRKPVAA